MELLVDDRALLDAFRRGDRAALERVYYAYVDRVFNYIRRGFSLESGARVAGLAEPDAQRELVQEIFEKAFRERARLTYDGLRPYGPYLLRIARNALIDLWRRRGAELSGADAAGELAQLDAELPPSADAGVVEDLHMRVLLDATQTCVSGMDDEMRRFIHHRFIEDLSQRDIAEKMAITRRRVRTLEERVLERLRKHLNEHGFL